MPQINLRVGEEQKERWESYADENPEVSSLSDLIRLGVEREIRGEHDQPSNFDIDTAEIDEIVDTHKQEIIETIQRTHQSLSNDLNQLDASVDDSERLTELATEIHAIVVELSEHVNLEDEDSLGAMRDHFIETGDATVENYTERLREKGYNDVDEYEVRRALEKLSHDVSRVVAIEEDGQTFYFRK